MRFWRGAIYRLFCFPLFSSSSLCLFSLVPTSPHLLISPSLHLYISSSPHPRLGAQSCLYLWPFSLYFSFSLILLFRLLSFVWSACVSVMTVKSVCSAMRQLSFLPSLGPPTPKPRMFVVDILIFESVVFDLKLVFGLFFQGD